MYAIVRKSSVYVCDRIVRENVCVYVCVCMCVCALCGHLNACAMCCVHVYVCECMCMNCRSRKEQTCRSRTSSIPVHISRRGHASFRRGKQNQWQRHQPLSLPTQNLKLRAQTVLCFAPSNRLPTATSQSSGTFFAKSRNLRSPWRNLRCLLTHDSSDSSMCFFACV